MSVHILCGRKGSTNIKSIEISLHGILVDTTATPAIISMKVSYTRCAGCSEGSRTVTRYWAFLHVIIFDDLMIGIRSKVKPGTYSIDRLTLLAVFLYENLR